MPMNGIDISNWQAGINLAAVPADFVIMKATQGTNYISPDCDRQYQQAKQAGRLLGVYHYVSGGNAVGEADFFVNNIKGYIGEAILVLDWEAEQNGAWGNEAYLEQVARRVIDHTGVKPLIYSMASRYAQVALVADKLDCGLWIAQYANNKPTGYQSHPWNEGAYGCAIRQYTSAGCLPGYDGTLDLNIAYMDRNAWMKYAAKNGKPAPAPAKPAPAPAKPAPAPKPAGRTYTVQAGDTLSGIAAKLGVSTSSISGYRSGNPNLIYPGEVLKINGGNTAPKPAGRTYTVRAGDNLSAIAAKYGTTYQALAAKNGISNPDLIHPGQVLKID